MKYIFLFLFFCFLVCEVSFSQMFCFDTSKESGKCLAMNSFDWQTCSYYYTDSLLKKAISLSKEDIQFCIDNIDCEQTSKMIGFMNLRSSNIPDCQFENYSGIYYAYLIDFCLSVDSLECISDVNRRFEDTKPYRIYNLCILVKDNENRKEKFKRLSHQDMVNIKKMYQEWWDNNKAKDMIQIKEEFRNGCKILKTPYVWL